MNKQRRKEIDEVITKLQDIQNEIECIRDDEQDYYDNMPESIQSGAKGDLANDAISALDSAISEVESAIDSLTESMQ